MTSGVSLIIPTRGRPQLALQTVQSILAGEQVPDELIVVDQSTTPDAVLARFVPTRGCEVRYLWTETTGTSRARNVGIAHARYDVLVFTDDDVLVAPTWLGALVSALRGAGERAAVSGQVLPGPPQSPRGFAPSTKVDEKPAVYEGRVGEDVLFSNNMAFFRSAIDRVGAFDERLGPGSPFLNAEDNDLGFRLLEAGYRILYVPEARLQHLAWRTDKDMLALRWSYGHGQGAFFAKHLSLRDRYMLHRACRHLWSQARGFGGQAVRGRRFALEKVVYTGAFLWAALKWLLNQRSRPAPREAQRGDAGHV